MKISTQNKVIMAAIEGQQAQPLARLLDNTNDLGIQFEFAVNRKRPGTYRIRLVGETMKGKSQLEKARAYMSACDFLAKHLGPEVKDGPWRYQMSSPAQNANKGDTWVENQLIWFQPFEDEVTNNGGGRTPQLDVEAETVTATTAFLEAGGDIKELATVNAAVKGGAFIAWLRVETTKLLIQSQPEVSEPEVEVNDDTDVSEAVEAAIQAAVDSEEMPPV